MKFGSGEMLHTNLPPNARPRVSCYGSIYYNWTVIELNKIHPMDPPHQASDYGIFSCCRGIFYEIMSTTLFFLHLFAEWMKKAAEYKITKKVDEQSKKKKIINGKNVKRIIKRMLSHGISAVRLYSHIIDSFASEKTEGIVFRERAENTILFYFSANHCASQSCCWINSLGLYVDSTK